VISHDPSRLRFLEPGLMQFPLTAHRSLLTAYRSPLPAHALPSRRLLVTTLTELKAIAALARIGLSRIPKAG